MLVARISPAVPEPAVPAPIELCWTFDAVPRPRAVAAAEAVVAPVPPLATASVPLSVSVPDVVIGEPLNVRPVVPPDAATDVTVPLPPEAAMLIVPLPFVIVMPEPAVSVALVRPLPLPISSCPLVYEV